MINGFYGKWEPGYVNKDTNKPSIEYLELYAVCVGLFVWVEHFRNMRLLIHCDNQAVVAMINNTSSSCKHCMILIRMLVLKTLKYNFRVFVRWVPTKLNSRADSLSRLQLDRFFNICKGKNITVNKCPEQLPRELWPASKIWEDKPENLDLVLA